MHCGSAVSSEQFYFRPEESGEGQLPGHSWAALWAWTQPPLPPRAAWVPRPPYARGTAAGLGRRFAIQAGLRPCRSGHLPTEAVASKMHLEAQSVRINFDNYSYSVRGKSPSIPVREASGPSRPKAVPRGGRGGRPPGSALCLPSIGMLRLSQPLCAPLPPVLLILTRLPGRAHWLCFHI